MWFSPIDVWQLIVELSNHPKFESSIRVILSQANYFEQRDSSQPNMGRSPWCVGSGDNFDIDHFLIYNQLVCYSGFGQKWSNASSFDEYHNSISIAVPASVDKPHAPSLGNSHDPSQDHQIMRHRFDFWFQFKLLNYQFQKS